ncbi:hypothetical protein [Flavobacterium sp. GNP001]
MKNCILSLVLLFSISYSQAQTSASGYYVSLSNDTIKAQIKLPKSVFGSFDFSKFLFKVEVVEQNTSEKKFKPDAIKSFGFTFEGQEYQFFGKPTVTKTNYKFLEAVVLGPKTSIYKFETVNQNGGSLGTFYTFEKADGTFEFFNTGMRNLEKFKDVLKEFYKDYPAAIVAIDARFKQKATFKSDIIAVAKAVNN